MAAPKRKIGAEILEGLRQLKRGEHGRITTVPPVATVREATGLSQPRFAELLGVSVRTLQEWEQGRRAPSGAARTLLLIAAKNPRALIEVVHEPSSFIRTGTTTGGRFSTDCKSLRCSQRRRPWSPAASATAGAE